MKIELPDSFYAMTPRQQEAYLLQYFYRHYAVIDRIKSLLGAVRGGKKLAKKDVN